MGVHLSRSGGMERELLQEGWAIALFRRASFWTAWEGRRVGWRWWWWSWSWKRWNRKWWRWAVPRVMPASCGRRPAHCCCCCCCCQGPCPSFAPCDQGTVWAAFARAPRPGPSATCRSCFDPTQICSHSWWVWRGRRKGRTRGRGRELWTRRWSLSRPRSRGWRWRERCPRPWPPSGRGRSTHGTM